MQFACSVLQPIQALVRVTLPHAQQGISIKAAAARCLLEWGRGRAERVKLGGGRGLKISHTFQGGHLSNTDTFGWSHQCPS